MTEKSNEYEAAEVCAMGRAQDVILGPKILPMLDTIVTLDIDLFFRPIWWDSEE
jgi:hypothetical protein